MAIDQGVCSGGRNLGANKLEGGIPEGLWSLTALQTLDLDTNQFRGTLSASVAELTKLTLLCAPFPAHSGDRRHLTIPCCVLALHRGVVADDGVR